MAGLLAIAGGLVGDRAIAAPPRIDREVRCDLLVVGASLAGTAAAEEALRAGLDVCLTDITDWVGGQVSSQGVSALDETNAQRDGERFPRGYREFRDRLRRFYGRLDPGNCWVSAACFLPSDAQEILMDQLQDAARAGGGTLQWFPNTVVKDLARSASPERDGGEWITGAIAIQHAPAPGAPPLHAARLSDIFEDAYAYADSDRLQKTILRFGPPEAPDGGENASSAPPWYVLEATETGELLALADLPYQVGVDPRSPFEPSASSRDRDPYCTQGFTYTFAMEATPGPQAHELPPFYDRYAPLYSYASDRDNQPEFDFTSIFTYRRIRAVRPDEPLPPARQPGHPVHPGDISMQNWALGNDYSPGTSADNTIYTRAQLQADGQLDPGGWRGGLRTETLAAGEEAALGFFYWLVLGTSDALLDDAKKQPNPNFRLLAGPDSPMGTDHGLSKYPYIREARRAIGRPSWGYPDGFVVYELDFSRSTYDRPVYRDLLSAADYRLMRAAVAGTEAIAVLQGEVDPAAAPLRARSLLYPDSVGIAHYNIDFHPCLVESPPETPGNREKPGERDAHGFAYPFQIPLRASIPQRVDNLLVAGKSIATSHIAAAAYRVHPFEWASGAATGAAAALALELGEAPYHWTDELPRREPHLELLQDRLEADGNPVVFPGTSIFNETWGDRADPW